MTELPFPPPAPVKPSFAGFVGEHWEAVYRMLWAMSGNTDDANRLTQETFLRAAGRWGRIDPETPVRVWLLSIASNAFLDARRRKNWPGPPEVEPPSLPEAEEDAPEIAEEAARVWEAAGGLSELTRMILHLRASEGLTFREIAVVTGTTVQAARWHMYHARTTILQHLGDVPGD